MRGVQRGSCVGRGSPWGRRQQRRGETPRVAGSVAGSAAATHSTATTTAARAGDGVAVSWRRGEQRGVHRDIRPGGARWTLACLRFRTGARQQGKNARSATTTAATHRAHAMRGAGELAVTLDGHERWHSCWGRNGALGFGRMDGYLCIAAHRCQPEVTMRVRAGAAKRPPACRQARSRKVPWKGAASCRSMLRRAMGRRWRRPGSAATLGRCPRNRPCSTTSLR